MTSSLFDLTAALSTVRDAAKQLNTADQGSQALAAMAAAISQHQVDILDAITLDLDISRDMAVPELVVEWLNLTPDRVQSYESVAKPVAPIKSLPTFLATPSGKVTCQRSLFFCSTPMTSLA